MRKSIKFFSLIMIITILFAPLALANITTDTITLTKFSDLDESYWAYDSIQKLVEAGIILGYPDGTFKPDGDITRAELVKIVNLVFDFTQKQETTSLTDVKSDDWFYDNVLIAQHAAYIIGYPDNTFRPNGFITRQELCKVLDSTNSFVDLPFDRTISDEVSPWAVTYVNKIISNRIMLLDENNNFRATEKATRAEVCDALAKFIIPEEDVVDNPIGNGNDNSSNNDDVITEQELNDVMDRVIRRLEKGVIPNLTSDLQKEIVNDIINNMNKYKADNSHDYKSAAEKVYEKYDLLTEKERDALQYQVQLQNATKDLIKLKEFFFPDVDI